ncbi:hypothetical protein [Kitasatospora terrestris]|uniref:Uncharacterized protein n=1 Tax=Kitasatospora terrestris TaxID=258051 RepID=A0ABP9DI39_9ACTN
MPPRGSSPLVYAMPGPPPALISRVGDGPALIVRSGTTNRSPSTSAVPLTCSFTSVVRQRWRRSAFGRGSFLSVSTIDAGTSDATLRYGQYGSGRTVLPDQLPMASRTGSPSSYWVALR